MAQFVASACPFQGVYQLVVSYYYDECENDLQSTVVVSGSAMTVNACPGIAKSNSYKNSK